MRANYYQLWRNKEIERMGGVCAQCGSSDCLEFDHIDSSQKEYSVAKIWSYRNNFVRTELDKCQLLCKSCHKQKTYKGLRHGTLTAHRHYKCRCELCKAAYNIARQRWGKKVIGA